MTRALPAGVVLFLTAAMLSGERAEAALFFTATLNGSQVVPPLATAATGTALVHLVGYPNMPGGRVFLFDMQADFTALTSSWSTAALYGPASMGQSGALLYEITETSGLVPPPGATTGMFGLMDQTPPPGMLDALNAGQVYLSISSNAFPGGEIRGQLIPIPEPSLTPLLMGAASLFIRRRGSLG